MNKELSPLEALEIINIKLKDKDNKYDRRVVNCKDEILYLIKQEELDIIEKALKDYEIHKLYICDEFQKFVYKYDFKTVENIELAFKSLIKRNNRFLKLLNKNANKLKALEIIKENVGLKMSVDDNVACLYVPITKCFQPLEKNIVVVGFVRGQDKIDLLKEVLL